MPEPSTVPSWHDAARRSGTVALAALGICVLLTGYATLSDVPASAQRATPVELLAESGDYGPNNKYGLADAGDNGLSDMSSSSDYAGYRRTA